jgi:hypothetical protein
MYEAGQTTWVQEDDWTAVANGIAFRADSRDPSEIFMHGFSPKDPQDDGEMIFRRARGDMDQSTAVCMTADPQVAVMFPRDRCADRGVHIQAMNSTYLYAVAVDDGFQLAPHLPNNHLLLYAREIAVPAVHRSQVILAAKVKRYWRNAGAKDPWDAKDGIFKVVNDGMTNMFADRGFDNRVAVARRLLARFIGRWWEMGHPPNRFADWQRLNQ